MLRSIGSEIEGQEGCMLELSWFNFVVKQQVLQGQWQLPWAQAAGAPTSGSTALGYPVCQCLDSHCCSSEFHRNSICICSHLKASKQLIILGEAGVKQGSCQAMRLGSKSCWEHSPCGLAAGCTGRGQWLKRGSAKESDGVWQQEKDRAACPLVCAPS